VGTGFRDKDHARAKSLSLTGRGCGRPAGRSPGIALPLVDSNQPGARCGAVAGNLPPTNAVNANKQPTMTRNSTHNMAYAADTIPTGRRSVALDNDTRQKVVIRPKRTARASARTSKLTGRKMHGPIDRRHRPITVPRCRAGEQHRAVGQRHQRRPAHHAAVAAVPRGKGQTQRCPRLPILRRSRRSGGFHFFDYQSEIQHPTRQNLGQSTRRQHKTKHRFGQLRPAQCCGHSSSCFGHSHRRPAPRNRTSARFAREMMQRRKPSHEFK
jgi:hypothetical protein